MEQKWVVVCEGCTTTEVFGVYASREEAERAQQKLQDSYPDPLVLPVREDVL